MSKLLDWIAIIACGWASSDGFRHMLAGSGNEFLSISGLVMPGWACEVWALMFGVQCARFYAIGILKQ